MRANPQSELHHLGKMFGVLVVEKDGTWQTTEGVWQTAEGVTFIAAFSAQLDGRYDHEGFVPPVYEMTPAERQGRAPQPAGDLPKRTTHPLPGGVV